MIRPCQAALEHMLDSRAANQRESLALINLDTPQIDSLVEVIVRHPGINPEARRLLARYADQVIALNTTEGECTLQATGALDPLCVRGLGIKIQDLRKALRPQIAAHTTNPQDGASYVRLVCTIRRYAEDSNVGPDVLRSQSLRHELGAGPHDCLCDLLSQIVCAHRIGVTS